jgi:hypothetical protein
VNAGSRSDAWSTWSNGRVEWPKESVSLDVKRAFPYGIYVGGDLGEWLLAQRFPGLLTRKRSQVQTLSRPPRPSDQWKRWSACCPGGGSAGRVPDGERFLCLTFLFMDPLGPDPLIRSFERRLTSSDPESLDRATRLGQDSDQ